MFYERLGKATFVGLITLGIVYLISLLRGPTDAPKEPQPEPVAVIKSRPTMDISVDELVERYNVYAQVMADKKILLPQHLNESARNDSWHMFQTIVHPTVAVTIEAMNASDKPFSLGFIGTPDTQARHLAMVSAMLAIGATVYGKGQASGALLRNCKEASESQARTVETIVEGHNVYCTVIDGAWIGGIAVPKSSESPTS